MAEHQQLLTAYPPPPSPARTRPPEREPLRLGLVQERWHASADEHLEALARGIRTAAGEGARVVCLQELTLSPYFAITPDGPTAAGAVPEELESGPTVAFAREVAAETGVYVHASLYERADAEPDDSGAAGLSEAGSRAGHKPDGLGFNTAVLVAPDGRLVSRTRKMHIPVTAGYYEDRYFRPGPADADAFHLVPLPTGDGEAQLGLPTCWDQWFPELARAYSIEGAEVLVYPTAIGSEPDHPEFDTQPLWQQVIVGNGVANGTFMVAINRIGVEPPLTFYGSSFISDPYGRVLVQAPRDEPAVLVADLDLDQRRDWLELFPFLTTRRPDAYGLLTKR
ncbi:MAG: nitrilase-related carbon-nitrogen hydrolase [Solirubrobacteraceae bacterium]